MPTTTEARSVDPTRTSVLRKRYSQHYRAMWQRVNAAINEYINTVDFSRPLTQRAIEFNGFVDALLQQEIGAAAGDRGRGLRAMATAAYMRGIAQANTEVEEEMPPAPQAVRQADHDSAIAALLLLLSTQLGGIRTNLAGQLLQQYQQANSASDAKAAIRDRIKKAGRTPTDGIAADGVVRGYNDALLNVYEAAGVEFVGVIDEKAFWQTAEDDRVCVRCYEASQRTDNGYGPGIYTINQARGLIPLHNRCRCRWRRLPPGTVRSQGTQPSARTRRYGEWRVPVELAPQNRTVAGLRRVAPVAQPAIMVPQQRLTYTPPKANNRLAINNSAGFVSSAAQQYGVSTDRLLRDAEGALTDLLGSQSRLAVQYPSQRVDALLNDGKFKTIFETASSNAHAQSLDFRRAIEEFGMGIPSSAADSARPVYGYLHMGMEAESRVGHYGDLTFFLKDDLKKRTTFTVADSSFPLGQQAAVAAPLTKPTGGAWHLNAGPLYQYRIDRNLQALVNEIDYIETQVQGGVPLSDVSAVLDRGGVLTQAQRQKLQSVGVQIWNNLP